MARQMAALQALKEDILTKLDDVPKWEKDIERIKDNDETLTEIDWDYLGVDGDTIIDLAEALLKNKHIKQISLCGNAIEDHPIITLCNAIRKNKKLDVTDLNISFNEITKESSEAISKLMLCPSINIQLFGNSIEREVDMNSGLRQTKRARKTARRTKSSKASKTSTKKEKPNAKKSLNLDDKQYSTEFARQIVNEDTSELDELEEKLAKLQDEEQDYIARIETLESRIISLMQEKTGESIKGSSSIFGKFKRSLTLEKQNIVITRKLADIGGSGAGVYSSLVDGWKCAMKELDTSHMSAYSIDGFKSEIRLLELLPQHENIARYLFHETSGKRIRLFMTQYNGSLGSYIQDRVVKDDKFSVHDIWRLCLDMIKGIEFLHSNGIIHRDLKSDNIFILTNEKNEIKKCAIGDFDTAKQVNKAEQAKTVLGTPAWMAPEVMDAKALGSYSYSCDVYSFGMIVYELLTLKMPYSGMNPMRIPMMVLQGEKPEEPNVEESYSEIVKLYKNCVEFNPKQRPSVKTIKSTIANNLVK